MRSNVKPSEEEAVAFANMLHVGLPPRDAILYFLEEDEAEDPTLVSEMIRVWSRSRRVGKEIERLQGGSWEALSLDQRIRVALDKHYAEKAYFLYSHTWGDVSGIDLTKLQESRKVLEAKMAGTSGKLDPLAQFYDDLKNGKVKLNQPTMVPPTSH